MIWTASRVGVTLGSNFTVGWAFAAGRLGAVIGPLLGGVMVGWGWHTDRILTVVGVPALIGAVAVAALLLYSRRSTEAAPIVATAQF